MSPRLKQIGFAVFTFAIYTLLLNWKAALLLTIGVGFHEYSHLWAANKLGLKTKGFLLIPFLGGVAFIGEKYKSYAQQAFVVLLGPVGGGLLALVIAVAWYITGYSFLAAAAFWMCFLNLFNLAPLSFLDGGQLMDTISYSVNRTFGMFLHIFSTVVALFVLWHFNPVLSVVVGFFGGSSIVKEFTNWRYYRSNQKYLCTEDYLNPPLPLSKLHMAITIGGWLLTGSILAVVMHLLNNVPGSAMSTIFHR